MTALVKRESCSSIDLPIPSTFLVNISPIFLETNPRIEIEAPAIPIAGKVFLMISPAVDLVSAALPSVVAAAVAAFFSSSVIESLIFSTTSSYLLATSSKS